MLQEWQRRAFQRQFNIGRYGRVPSAHAANTWVRNFEETDPLLRSKVTVWCAVSSSGVGRYIFEDDGGLTTTVVDWIDMAPDRDQWRALVNTVLNLRVP
jgi:hypothetical protein